MVTYTAKQWKLKFGAKAGALFNLTKIIGPQHIKDCMETPTLAVLRHDFGNLDRIRDGKQETIYFRLEVRYWLVDDPTLLPSLRIRGIIDAVTLFSSQFEMDREKTKYTNKG